MANIDKMMKDGTFDTLSKREKLQITRQRAKLEKNLGSIQDMSRLPSALFVVDVMKEHIAVSEANRLGIPVFGVVDTNSDPSNVDFIIPANDDAAKAIDMILGFLCDAIKEGFDERKVEKADSNAAEEQDEETAETPRRERKSKVAKKERVKQEDKEAMNASMLSKYAKDAEVDE